ncbi:hypothetical protein EHW97_13910 [Aeromicrobium camelliae]|uniref:DUF3137 domain-containing protein n=1 Tax=Aeromicrobium camelliae TaxID=1538144 RepID=A0A3N6XX08_9ACTN|nr:hypothetical protein [Aeromicrobium camelliae]RQN02234.1 hypothetical protein EHW97_13910 [Aeromicrobium camelliae]
MASFSDQRRDWARRNGWSYEEQRTIEPDLFGQLSWRGPGERDQTVTVVGEMRGRYGTRDAFAHDRPLPLLRAEVRAQISFGRISGLSTHAELPFGFILLERHGLHASIYPLPWAEGLTAVRRPFGTTTAVWVQPGTEDLVMPALGPVLQNAKQILASGSDRRYLVGFGGGQVLVGEPFESDPEAALYRMALGDDVATRLERALLNAT